MMEQCRQCRNYGLQIKVLEENTSPLSRPKRDVRYGCLKGLTNEGNNCPKFNDRNLPEQIPKEDEEPTYRLYVSINGSEWVCKSEGCVDDMLDESQEYLLNGYDVRMCECKNEKCDCE